MDSEKYKEGGKISCGNIEIDKKLGGGIPRGSLILIEGQSDSGKSVLSQQMIWGSLNHGCKVTLFSTENTVKSLINQMKSLNLDVLDYLLLGYFKVYPVQLMKGDRVLLEQSLRILSAAIKAESDCDLVIIDSLTPFVTHSPLEETIAFFEDCKYFCNEDLTIVTVIHSYAFDRSTIIRLSSMCDAHLCLRTTEVGDKIVRELEVAKVRGASKTTGNIITFEVEPGWGMRILPISKAKA